MNWKEIGLKLFKGAVSGVSAIMGGLFVSGVPMDQNVVKMATGGLISSAIHGIWNVAEQRVNRDSKGESESFSKAFEQK